MVCIGKRASACRKVVGRKNLSSNALISIRLKKQLSHWMISGRRLVLISRDQWLTQQLLSAQIGRRLSACTCLCATKCLTIFWSIHSSNNRSETRKFGVKQVGKG